MVKVGNKVYFLPHLQHSLYFKGYEDALSAWRVLECLDGGERVKVQPDRCRRNITTGHLVVALKELAVCPLH
jgi:hypothetical protein